MGDVTSVPWNEQRPGPDPIATRGLKVLLIDDDVKLGELLSQFLVRNQVSVSSMMNGRDGLREALEGAYDLILLDVMLPVMDGFEVLRLIRRRSAVPVILLTARTEHEDRLEGFKHGADDYLSKPFHPEELLARCRALLRRSSVTAQKMNYQVGELSLDSSSKQALADGTPLELTIMEFDLLDQLAHRPGRVVTREEIWAAIHQREPSPSERALDTHISNLRKKMAGRGGVSIRTIRNTGYLLSVVQ
jgi:two-component system response regulator CpxR